MTDLTGLHYPTYVTALPEGLILIYIPNSGGMGIKDAAGNEINLIKHKILTNITDTVIESFYFKQRLHFFDAIPTKDFESGKCALIYEDRRRLLHECLNRLGNYNLFTELYNDFCYSPLNIKQFYSYCLLNGYKGATVRSMYGLYSFGKETEDVVNLYPRTS